MFGNQPNNKQRLYNQIDLYIMAKYIPIINCGYLAGESPEVWNGIVFESEEECYEWIDGHMDEFSEEEVGGSIYAQEVI